MVKLLAGVRQHMQSICTHKISVQSSKPPHAYPIILLPRKYRELAGLRAEVYQIAHQGKLTFLVVTDKQVDNSCLLDPELDTEARLSTLESEISEFKSLLFLNEGASLHKIENKWARPDSNRRPPPCQGGRFWDFCGLFFARNNHKKG